MCNFYPFFVALDKVLIGGMVAYLNKPDHFEFIHLVGIIGSFVDQVRTLINVG